jgi:nucleoside-diphosphate-sugar epimerase
MTRTQYFKQPDFIPIFTDYMQFSGKCIGITGQRGVLGGILSERLIAHNVRVEAYPFDVTDAASLNAWFKKHNFDYFFHFAAIVPVIQVMNEPLKAYRVNVIGSYNICNQIIETQPNCWLFLASSSHIYKSSPIPGEKILKVGSSEGPESFYGVTKLAAERISRPILDQCKVDYCIGRIFSFSSRAQKEPYLIPTLRRKIAEAAPNDVLEIINPDSIRDIMDADTVIDCVLHLAQKRFKGTINIGSGKGMSIMDIGQHMMKLLEKRNQIRGVNKSQPNALVADVHDLKQVIAEKG